MYLKKLVFNTDPNVILIENVLSAEECDSILSRNLNFDKSSGFDYSENKSTISDYRSSYSFYDYKNEFSFLKNRAVDIARQYVKDINLTTDHCELIQIQRYEVGGEYKKHFDFFNYETLQGIDNDRCCTVIYYLNDGFQGGETQFTALNFNITPKKGTALFFDYCYDVPRNKLTYHAGLPVLSGQKNIATVWMHHKPYTGSQPSVR